MANLKALLGFLALVYMGFLYIGVPTLAVIGTICLFKH